MKNEQQNGGGHGAITQKKLDADASLALKPGRRDSSRSEK